ncbi:hypothetical protein DV515_00015102 [Chloebia gouldiae]|uniref:CUB domain-containing protein n=1 Tax=Chloebia gouldiae TaxID=44316 RepID=A0A3L8RXT7_CHLGU|nr:hypothetical protein DV515_00015102 [Chloebia gouldiae]
MEGRERGRECGGPLTALEGHLSTPNHPQPYPHQQVREGALREHGEGEGGQGGRQPRPRGVPLPSFTGVAGCPPAPQLCLWQISVPLGHVIDLHFHNFSLESHEDCSFDFVEVHDSAGTGAASLMGRYPTPPGLLRLPGDTGAVAQLGKLRHGAGWSGRATRRLWGGAGQPPDPISCPMTSAGSVATSCHPP